MARTNWNQQYAEIKQAGDSLALLSSYDAGLVAALKSSIPYTERTWDNQNKAWIVAPQHGQLLADLCAQYLGVQVQIPMVRAAGGDEIQILDIRYVGATKPRDGADERTAFGFYRGSWSVIFPESVLLLWFTGLNNRVEATTLYGVLGVQRSADQDAIKSAFRKMARMWHPDHCKEPDAAEMFMRIKDAYDLLSSSKMRARYDAGLALEATLKQDARMDQNGYRSPLRCGYVQALCTESVGRYVVKQILNWEDITDGSGRTLITSWPKGSDRFVETWV
jgi:hypothetical protein